MIRDAFAIGDEAKHVRVVVWKRCDKVMGYFVVVLCFADVANVCEEFHAGDILWSRNQSTHVGPSGIVGKVGADDPWIVFGGCVHGVGSR